MDSKIKFVYFDVGGVVIRDFSGTDEWIKMKRRFGLAEKDEEKFKEEFKKVENKACVGESIENFLPVAKEKLHLIVPENYIFLDDFVNNFSTNLSIWPVVEEIKKSFKVGLLTNMYFGMFEKIVKRELFPPIEWDIIIDSSVEKLSKPGIEIYRLAQERAGVLPQEILFIDNTQKNLESAECLGWQVYWYDSSDYEASSQKLLEFIRGLSFVT